MQSRILFLSALAALLFLHAEFVLAQTTEFTYQGSLSTAGAPANGGHDFEFLLFDAVVGGSPLGSTIVLNNIAVTNGTFTVKLDFGNQFISGTNRFLEIRLRPSGQGGMTTLSPRQLINSAPYAIKSLGAFNAESATTSTIALTANNALQLGGVAAGQYVITTDPRMTDARPPTAGSPSYIQNGTSPQAASNFNISNTGSANVFNAANQYNLGGFRILGNAGTNNLFAGIGAGIQNTTGLQNTFVGARAGIFNTTGNNNTFVGMNAGSSNTIASANSFFGTFAGESNTSGINNAFFGESAGKFNSSGARNAFFGRGSGLFNTIGEMNSFFGESAGLANTEGIENAFFGTDSGRSNTNGNQNSFFGAGAGAANTAGTFNSYFGTGAGATSSTGTGNSYFGYRAGHFSLFGDNSFFGARAGFLNSTGASNSFFGVAAGDTTTSGTYNVFIGKKAGSGNESGSRNTLIGSDSSLSSPNFNFATAIGSGATALSSNSITLGREEGQDLVRIQGNLALIALSTGGVTSICRNAFLLIATCSSSARYKSNITVFASGLDLIRKLRPVSFNWKDGGMLDIGLVAEEVNKIEPLLTTTNVSGEVEGVKYDRVSVVLINAIKEQQAEIESLRQDKADLRNELRRTTRSQQDELKALKAIACSIRPNAAICRRSHREGK